MPAPVSQTDFRTLAKDDVKPDDQVEGSPDDPDGTEGSTEVDDAKTAREKEEALRRAKEMVQFVVGDQVDKMAKFVNRYRPSVNVVDLDDPLRPPLLLVACQRNNLKMAALLMSVAEHPADVNAADVTGLRPLG